MIYLIIFLTPYHLILSITPYTQRPARPLLSSGPVSYPMNRPIAAILESDTVPSSSARPSGQSGRTLSLTRICCWCQNTSLPPPTLCLKLLYILKAKQESNKTEKNPALLFLYHKKGNWGSATVQYSTVRYSTVQYSTVQYSRILT